MLQGNNIAEKQRNKFKDKRIEQIQADIRELQENESDNSIAQKTAPSPSNGSCEVWTASASGTKDGTSYDEADVLVTSVNQAGTSKTLILMDFSTL